MINLVNLLVKFFVSRVNHFLQQKVRENREARKRMITDEYRFLMGIVGGYVDLDVSAVEEFVLDSEEVSLTLSARFCP